MLNRIDKKFKELKKDKKKAFIAFITAGYPNIAVTEKLIREFDREGVSLLELGVPFSDPMADGAVIQEASSCALKNKISLMDILKLVKKVRKDVNIPLLLMTYYNPVFALGEDRFIRLAVACGVDGVIIPDLPFDEGKNFTLKAAKAGLHNISFVSPVTSPSRIKLISRKSRGFIYYISLTGVTGMRGSLPAGLKKNIALIKRSTKTPVCVGFGVSNAALAKEAGRACDGVIVGSAIVSRIKDNIKNPKLIRCLVDFVKAMA